MPKNARWWRLVVHMRRPAARGPCDTRVLVCRIQVLYHARHGNAAHVTGNVLLFRGAERVHLDPEKRRSRVGHVHPAGARACPSSASWNPPLTRRGGTLGGSEDNLIRM